MCSLICNYKVNITPWTKIEGYQYTRKSSSHCFCRSASITTYFCGTVSVVRVILLITLLNFPPQENLRASLVAQLLKNTPVMQETLVQFLGQKFPCRRDRLPTPVFMGFPGGSDGQESACNAGDLGSIPGLGRSPAGRDGNPLQYSCLENPHGQKSLVSIVHRVAKSWT